MSLTLIRGPLLNPQSRGKVDYLPDGTIVADEMTGKILWVGSFDELPSAYHTQDVLVSSGVILPPFLDMHTHLPQHPIRGRFTEGIEGDPEEGRLLAGLRQNVFPLEGRCADPEHTSQVIRAFAEDTLSHGVVGGLVYGTVHVPAADTMLGTLSELWSVGLVLMNSHCPEYLRTNEETLERDIETLAERWRQRFIVTDRFAVSVTSPLRKRAARAAKSLGLRMQTHLNEQREEKRLIERVLYPGYDSYTDVYRKDGLLTQRAILAHCIQMTPPEWAMLADNGSAIAHCPTSNTLLGSGTMPLDDIPASVPYAICTDVGASPTCSLLAEMAQFLKVHADRSARATPEEALYRATLAPAQILGIDDLVGTFAPGMPLSYIEVALPPKAPTPQTATDAILSMLEISEAEPVLAQAIQQLGDEGLPYGALLQVLTEDVHQTARRFCTKVRRVVLEGKTVWQRT